MKGLRRVKITWQDITADQNWQDIEDIDKVIEEFKKEECYSTGYVIYEDKEILMVAPDISLDKDKEISRYSYVIIPKSPVKSIKKI